MIDADQHVGPQRFDLGVQLGELAPVLPIAREEDQPAGKRMAQAAPVVVVEGEPGDVEHDWSMALAVHGRALSAS